jgi:predicted ATPase with chaperone activity
VISAGEPVPAADQQPEPPAPGDQLRASGGLLFLDELPKFSSYLANSGIIRAGGQATDYNMLGG